MSGALETKRFEVPSILRPGASADLMVEIMLNKGGIITPQLRLTYGMLMSNVLRTETVPLVIEAK